MKLRIAIKNGRIVKGRETLAKLIENLPDGEYIWPAPVTMAEPHTVDEWRKLYFFLRDTLHEETDTGYTKQELHDAIKEQLIKQLWHDWKTTGAPYIREDIAIPMTDSYSTRWLTPQGWKEYVRRFKEFAMETFEIYI